MKEWAKNFWTENGTRLTYASLVYVMTLPMYYWIPALQEKLEGIWLVLIGIFVGKVKTSFGEIQVQIAKNSDERNRT